MKDWWRAGRHARAAKLLDGEMPVPPPGSAQPPRIHFTHIEYKEYEHYEFIFI